MSVPTRTCVCGCVCGVCVCVCAAGMEGGVCVGGGGGVVCVLRQLSLYNPTSVQAKATRDRISTGDRTCARHITAKRFQAAPQTEPRAVIHKHPKSRDHDHDRNDPYRHGNTSKHVHVMKTVLRVTASLASTCNAGIADRLTSCTCPCVQRGHWSSLSWGKRGR